MSKILFAGDWHGSVSHAKSCFQYALDHGCHTIIQVGDFGLFWKSKDGEPCETALSVSAFAKDANITCYVIDGNHENFSALSAWRDGRKGVVELATNVYHIPRGQVLSFGKTNFLFCGGATSIDKKYRTPYVSWWPQENITDADVVACDEAVQWAQKPLGKIDVFVCHDFPWECNIIARHLDPSWGQEAQDNVIKNRQQISRILSFSGASQVIHGHLHIRYDEWITCSGRAVLVHGLDCDQSTVKASTIIFDTELDKEPNWEV